MRKVFHLLTVFIFLCVGLSAQNLSLTSASNALREGDCLHGVSLSAFSNGEAGCDRVWTYSEENLSETGQTVEYYALGDTVVGLGDGTRYFYRQSADSLCLLGFDNRNSYILYDSPMPLLCYPFCYGDSVSHTFTGHGVYGDRLFLGVAGRCSTVADACGVLACGDDTITGIIRVRHHRETVRRTAHDTIPVISPDNLVRCFYEDDGVMTEDIFSYYKSGCRYPVIISAVSSGRYGGRKIPHASRTVLYSPRQQEYDIHYDSVNEAVRISASSSGSDKFGGTHDTDDFSNRIYGMTATSYGNSVRVSYAGSTPENVTLSVFDTLGRRLSSVYTVSTPCDITLPLLYSARNALLLHVVSGEKKAIIKIKNPK